VSDRTLRGYEAIKALAAETGRTTQDLLVLAHGNDPFYIAQPYQRRDAEWFVDIWRQFGFGNGIHVRRIHYRLVSQKEPVLFRNGARYINTDKCWTFLENASKYARCLRLVDPADFVDRRNPEPRIFAGSRAEPFPGVIGPDCKWELPCISVDFETRLDLPSPLIDGYDYTLSDQRYHLAVWIEKSTMNDILEPICERYGIDLVTGVGFQSITSVIRLLHRAASHAKPVRIFYISDHDPAGDQMPVAIARQVEFWRLDYAPDVEIKLQPLALTKAQVTAYGLPRIPIKDKDKRKANFEDRHGEGACELDALEALHPGELGRIVREAIAPYFDRGLSASLYEAESEADDIVNDEWEILTQPEADELAEIRLDAEKITAAFEKRATILSEDFDREIAPLQRRLDGVRHAMQQKSDDFDPELPERPEPAITDADESAWLFDSSRSYLDQLGYYPRPAKRKSRKKQKGNA
jgi:hypothetical protein